MRNGISPPVKVTLFGAISSAKTLLHFLAYFCGLHRHTIARPRPIERPFVVHFGASLVPRPPHWTISRWCWSTEEGRYAASNNNETLEYCHRGTRTGRRTRGQKDSGGNDYCLAIESSTWVIRSRRFAIQWLWLKRASKSGWGPGEAFGDFVGLSTGWVRILSWCISLLSAKCILTLFFHSNTNSSESIMVAVLDNRDEIGCLGELVMIGKIWLLLDFINLWNWIVISNILIRKHMNETKSHCASWPLKKLRTEQASISSQIPKK